MEIMESERKMETTSQKNTELKLTIVLKESPMTTEMRLDVVNLTLWAHVLNTL